MNVWSLRSYRSSDVVIFSNNRSKKVILTKSRGTETKGSEVTTVAVLSDGQASSYAVSLIKKTVSDDDDVVVYAKSPVV